MKRIAIDGKPFIKHFLMSDKMREHYYAYTFAWILTDNNTTYYLFLPTPENKYEDMIKLMVKRVNVMRKHYNIKKKQNIYIWMSPLKKYYADVITYDNINSGCTMPNGDIYLWREEEILKVLIHELNHAFNLDDYPKPSEAYTELYALYANIYFELAERGLNNYEEVLCAEKAYSQYLAEKVKNCTGNTNIHAYITEKSRLLGGCEIDTETIQKLSFLDFRLTIAEVFLEKYPRHI